MHHLVGMAEIAEILGVSRQRVAQLIETYDDFPKPEVELTAGRVWSRTAIETWIASHPERGPGRAEEGEEKKKRRFFGSGGGGLFSKFTDRARTSIIKGQEEARLLNHNYIGTEHLLLGLVGIGEGVAFEVLEGFGISLEAVRTKVLDMIGRGNETPTGHIPFTPRAKKVLELALREAVKLAHNYIGTEHILLALVREGEGVAWQALEQLGMTEEGVRGAVRAKLEGFAPLPPSPPKDDTCSFCGKAAEDVLKLIAGPGVYICNECVDLSEKIIRGELGETPPPERDLALRIEALERRLEDLEKE